MRRLAHALPAYRSALIALGAMLGLVTVTKAQVFFDISPYAGFYVPLRSMLVPSNPPQQNYGYAPGGPVTQQRTLALGAHLTVWSAGRFGVEATFGYAPSGVTIGCRVLACNAGHVVTGSAKLVVPLIGVTSQRSFYVGGGAGMVGHGGPAYIGVTNTTSVAGTVGAGLALKLWSSGSLRVEAEDYLFRPHLGWQECNASYAVCRALVGSWNQQFQHDVILSIGLVFRTE